MIQKNAPTYILFLLQDPAQAPTRPRAAGPGLLHAETVPQSVLSPWP